MYIENLITFDPDTTDKGTPPVETKSQEKKEETKLEVPSKSKYKINGQEVELDSSEVQSLIELGANAYLEKQNKQAHEKKEPEDTYDPRKDVQSLRTEISLRDMNAQFKELASLHELTKGDADMAQTIKDLTLVKLHQSGGKGDLEKIYKEQVKFLGDKLAKGKSEYVENKIKDSVLTKGPSGGSSPSMKSDKITGKDIVSGQTRRNVMEKFKSGVYK